MFGYPINNNRYETMPYRSCGNSGLKLSALSLGLWQNFGFEKSYDQVKDMILTAFDLGITHFDCADNYGQPAGSAEINLGKVLKEELASYRNELVIATKAGYPIWPGPYGDGGSKKHLFAALDRSLIQLETDYVDIFYHHHPDPQTPLLETLSALDAMVRSGKVLYIGLSKYTLEQIKTAVEWFTLWQTPFVALQVSYSMLERTIEDNGILENATELGYSILPFSPLAQGLLSDRYLKEIPSDSRAKNSPYLHQQDVNQNVIDLVKELNDIALHRNQSVAQLAIAWNLRLPQISSVIIGASRKEQIIDNIRTLENMEISPGELLSIEELLNTYYNK